MIGSWSVLATVVVLELISFKGLSKLPVRRSYVVRSNRSATARGDLEGESLPRDNGIALPVLTPVPRQSHPPRIRPLHLDICHDSVSTHVCNQDQIEVMVSVYSESYPSFLHTRHSSVFDWHDSGPPDADLLEGRHGQVEVL